MNSEIIRRHNERVKPEDIVYFLGDFCFRSKSERGEGDQYKADYYLKHLNGKFIFIQGNHDRNNTVKTNIMKLVIHHAGYDICLLHNPEYADMRYNINFVGHVHEKWMCKRVRSGETFTDLINVGCDVHNFYPQTFEDLMGKYHQWRRNEDKKILNKTN
jgi:calcineurin-like phosphoesterase family protein